jgi:hypothetical protein
MCVHYTFIIVGNIKEIHGVCSEEGLIISVLLCEASEFVVE